MAKQIKRTRKVKTGNKIVVTNRGLTGSQRVDLRKTRMNNRTERVKAKERTKQVNAVGQAAKGIGQGVAYSTASPSAAYASTAARYNNIVTSYSDEGKDEETRDTDNSRGSYSSNAYGGR